MVLRRAGGEEGTAMRTPVVAPFGLNREDKFLQMWRYGEYLRPTCETALVRG